MVILFNILNGSVSFDMKPATIISYLHISYRVTCQSMLNRTTEINKEFTQKQSSNDISMRKGEV